MTTIENYDYYLMTALAVIFFTLLLISLFIQDRLRSKSNDLRVRLDATAEELDSQRRLLKDQTMKSNSLVREANGLRLDLGRLEEEKRVMKNVMETNDKKHKAEIEKLRGRLGILNPQKSRKQQAIKYGPKA